MTLLQHKCHNADGETSVLCFSAAISSCARSSGTGDSQTDGFKVALRAIWQYNAALWLCFVHLGYE